MTKKDYKRYKQIKLELELLEQDKEDLLKRIQQLYDERNIKVDGVNGAFTTLKLLLKEIGLRRTILSELTLPRYIKIIWSGDEQDMPKGDMLEEHIAMHLTDDYNHNLYGFDWVAKGTTIYVTNIRWNKGQILANDLKHNAKTDVIVNDLVSIVRNNKYGVFFITDNESKHTIRIRTLKEAIRWLESQYYM